MLTTLTPTYPQSWRGIGAGASVRSRRSYKRGIAITLGALALGTIAAALVAAYDNQLSARQAVSNTSAGTQLPKDLFSRPVPPKPRVIIQYVNPRSAQPAPVAASPAPMAAKPSPAAHRPVPTPTPGPPGGDD